MSIGELITLVLPFSDLTVKRRKICAREFAVREIKVFIILFPFKIKSAC